MNTRTKRADSANPRTRKTTVRGERLAHSQAPSNKAVNKKKILHPCGRVIGNRMCEKEKVPGQDYCAQCRKQMNQNYKRTEMTARKQRARDMKFGKASLLSIDTKLSILSRRVQSISEEVQSIKDAINHGPVTPLEESKLFPTKKRPASPNPIETMLKCEMCVEYVKINELAMHEETQTHIECVRMAAVKASGMDPKRFEIDDVFCGVCSASIREDDKYRHVKKKEHLKEQEILVGTLTKVAKTLTIYSFVNRKYYFDPKSCIKIIYEDEDEAC